MCAGRDERIGKRTFELIEEIYRVDRANAPTLLQNVFTNGDKLTRLLRDWDGSFSNAAQAGADLPTFSESDIKMSLLRLKQDLVPNGARCYATIATSQSVTDCLNQLTTELSAPR